MEVYNHDLVILGTGLAGLRAALEAVQQSKGELNIALVSKLQLMRAHSVAAEGGTAAVLRQDEGDSYELHAWDTIKGSDFLADQDVVDFFVHEMPKGRSTEVMGYPRRWQVEEDAVDQGLDRRCKPAVHPHPPARL